MIAKTRGAAFQLYVWTMVNCPFCERAKTHLRAFTSKHLADGLVINKDLDRCPEYAGFAPKGAPAYLLRIDGENVGTFLGVLTESELERFLTRGRVAAGDEDEAPKKRKKPKVKRPAAHEDVDEENETAAGIDDTDTEPDDDGEEQ
jgi:hypothetical protein